jgi:Cu2+-exporting ATPase
MHHDPKKFRNQFWLALALTIPTMVFSHSVQMLLGYQLEFSFSYLIPAAFGTLMFFTGGRVFLIASLHELRAKKPGMMALISLALVVAFGYSLFITIVQLLGYTITGMDFWWELAALVTIMLLGHWIEMKSIASANASMGELALLMPDTADLIEGEQTRKVQVSELRVGDLVLVRAGAAIPADGVVVEGHSKVNEAMITGESAEVAKVAGDEVIAGTINSDSSGLGQGALTVRVGRIGEDTMLAGVLRLVRDAQASKSKTQILADRAAGWLFYVALGSALITAIVWISIGGQTPDFILERVVTVLVIACPHALGLAIPLVSAISVSQAAKSGLLIRNRLAFETAQNVDVVLFDKTGTLTTAERGFLDAKLAHSSSLSSVAELLSLAAGVERESEHPIGRAILAEAVRRNLEIPQVLDVRTIPGQGVTGILEATNLIVGGPIVLTGRNINIDVHDLVLADTANRSGNSVVYVVRESELLGLIEVGDSIRPTSKQAVFELQLQRKRVAILTGDAKGVAESVAAKLGITEIFAEVLPHQKAEIVSRLQADGSIVAMVGDGINDAPALAQADVGLAIGTGTSVAIESAGILLVSNDPMSVSKAITLSKRSVAKMTQNLWWAAGYNLIAIPLAAGVFLPLGLVLSPAVGAILMSLSTIAVAANAQLLRK